MLTNLKRIITLRSGVAATAQTLLANILIVGINIATGVITARLLGPSGRGEQAAVMIWPQLLAFALTLGLPDALLYSFKRYPDRQPQLFSAALLLGAPMGGVGVMVGVIFLPYWLDQYSPAVIQFAQLGVLLTPVVLITLILTAVVQAREQFALYNAVRYLPPLLTLIALVLLALVHRLTPFSAALAYMLAIIPVFLWMLVRLWRLFRPRWYGLRWAFKDLTPYGLRAYGISLAKIAAQYLDRVLAVGLLDPAVVGLYVVARSLSLVLEVFHTAVASVLFPKASGRPVEEVVAMTGLAARVSTTLTLLAALGLALSGAWALSLVYGEAFLAAGAVFRILAIEVVLSGTAWILAQAFMALGKPGLITLFQGLGISLSVPLFLVLVPRYGLEGVGLALLISTVVRLMLVIASFPLILKVRIPRLWIARADLGAVLYLLQKRTTRE